MLEIVEAHHGPENHRYGLRLEDDAQIEAVVYREDSLCVSSQVGCAVACPFCASGAQGLARNLRLEELIGQVRVIRERHPDIARITLSGIGEPLHNFKATAEMIEWGRAEGLPVSLTTSGGPLPRLEECLTLPHRGLTVSVHAGHESSRSRLVPHGPPLAALFSTLEGALPSLSASKRRKIALAYLLLSGENDSDREIDAFLDLAVPLGLKVQLYAHNPIADATQNGVAHHTDPLRYQRVFELMVERGLDVRRSSQARTQANGGCGTLLALGPKRATLTRLRSHRT
jgi:23S rRNA (adenine2503-C2)-methyltransferase